MAYAFELYTDSCCDLPFAQVQVLELAYVPLTVQFRGREYENDLQWKRVGPQEFYRGLRQKEMATTSAVNAAQWEALLEPGLQQGKDALVLAFSSGLSSTYQSAVLAAEELAQRYPERTIRVIDTLAASMGQGLLCYYAARHRQAGESLAEVARWVEENKLRICHWFTVDDLMFLKRGGRISAGTAVVGSMLQMKPVLHVDAAGKLVSTAKARGRKASIDALAMHAAAGAEDKRVMFISHGDCPEDAAYLERLLKEDLGVEQVVTGCIGPVIGSHAGPGTLALFFLGSDR